MPVSAPALLFSAETFEQAARAVARAWEEEAQAERAGAEAKPSCAAAAAAAVALWRWVPSASRFAGALGGGFLEAVDPGSMLPGVSMPLLVGEEGEGPLEEGAEGEENEEEEDEDEPDAATLPRPPPRRRGDGGGGASTSPSPSPSPPLARVELHVCFGASYRAPLMLVRVADVAATAAGPFSTPRCCSLEALERSLAAAASPAGTSATGGGGGGGAASCPAGPLAPCEHPLLPASGGGGWAALHACASAGAVAEMMIAETTKTDSSSAATEADVKRGGREGETQPPPPAPSSPDPPPSRAACALAAWMSLACPAVGVRPPLGLWRRVREGEKKLVKK